MWRPGCNPGAWRRGSWLSQAATLHLHSIVDLCPLHMSCCIFPSRTSVAGGECRPRSEAPYMYVYVTSLAYSSTLLITVRGVQPTHSPTGPNSSVRTCTIYIYTWHSSNHCRVLRLLVCLLETCRDFRKYQEEKTFNFKFLVNFR